MKINISEANSGKYQLKAPKCSCNSDYFVCNRCGYGLYLKVLGNSTYCRNPDINCGGTMYRK